MRGELRGLDVGQVAGGARLRTMLRKPRNTAQAVLVRPSSSAVRARAASLARVGPTRPASRTAVSNTMRSAEGSGGGSAAAYVKSSAAAAGLCTPLTVTRTLTLPDPCGLTAVHVVALAQPTASVAAPPKWTTVAPGAVLKAVPVIVTAVLPTAGPLVGEMLVTDGRLVNGMLLLFPLCVPTASATVPTPGDRRDRRGAEVRVVVSGCVQALLPVGGDAYADRA